jgi:protein-S-isoprenylcysteine O-methyltransferase Ste14
MPATLLAYFLTYFAVAFVWPTWRLWRRDRINALVLPFDDTAYGVVSKGFRLLILGLFAVLIAALWLPMDQFGPLPWLDHAAVRIAGIVLMVGSLILIVVAQAQMGRSWRIGIDTGRSTALVQTGVFSRSRNPIFLSMRINLLGLVLIWPNAATLTAFLLGEVLMQVQVRLEEDHLGRMLGTEYTHYRSRTPRWALVR